MQSALQSKNGSFAKQHVTDLLLLTPDDSDLLQTAAIIAGKGGRPDDAAELLDRSVRAAKSFDRRRVELAIHAQIEIGRLYDAIELLQWVLQRQPEQSSLRRTLIGFLGEAQRVELIPPHLQRLFRDREFDAILLEATTVSSSRRFASSTLDQLLKRNPDDARVLLGKAKAAFDDGQFATAVSILQSILSTQPDFGPAAAMLGRALSAGEDLEGLHRWVAGTTPEAANYGDYWIGLGDYFQHQTDSLTAVAAYARATELVPDEPAGWSKLIAAIRIAGDRLPPLANGQDWKVVSRAAAQRINDLGQLSKHFFLFAGTQRTDASECIGVAESLQALGRYWEAEAWSAVALTLQTNRPPEIEQTRKKIVGRLRTKTPWQVVEGRQEFVAELPRSMLLALRAQLETSRSLNGFRRAAETPPPVSSDASIAIQLRDRAAQCGLNFYGAVGGLVHGPHVPLSQSLGCGGGVIDLDLDGRPDLYFAAAGGDVYKRNSQPNRLFRNLDSGNFQSVRLVDVTEPTGSGDTGFGQGICVGDVNQDGFDDIWILNLGPNRFLRNNGDGTFRDCTAQIGISGADRWSTSGAIVDIDGDGLLDMVAVNYAGAGEIEKVCVDAAGEPAGCNPIQFSATSDTFWHGAADGGFVDVTQDWTDSLAPGLGLGILAGRLDGESMTLFVANDVGPNHHLHFDGQRLQDTAAYDGLALDGQGTAQASMGMASIDFDQDGDLDFYVTGFAGEYNILYRQQQQGVWTDQTAAHELVSPTMDRVGFGTQAVDLTADGIDELIVANGHISDFGRGAPPYAQRPQIFKRLGNSFDSVLNFAEAAGESDYFAKPHVGRCLFVADLNLDGRKDVIVTHATEPVAVLMNETAAEFSWIGIKLVGTQCSRDAAGSTVSLVYRNSTDPNGLAQQRSFQIISGDGYYCSNESTLHFNFPLGTVVQCVEVRWCEGSISRIKSPESGQLHVVVQSECE